MQRSAVIGVFAKYQPAWLSLRLSQVACQAGAYPGFRSMKRLGVFLLPPGWDADYRSTISQ